jgi:uroporphyrin-3 C-methyltransferase/uroporphyrinogen III methyltransferase/synthase
MSELNDSANTPRPAADAQPAPSASGAASATSSRPDASTGSLRSRLQHAVQGRESRLKLAVAALAVLLALQWWNTHTDISGLRREVAQRLKSGDNLNIETKRLVDRLDEELRSAQGKLAVLEARQVESQSQQIALEQMYRELAKNRDDWALAEIEQVLSTASQQLQLAGNVRGALIALQNADTRLSRADRPQFIAIRRAIAQDMDKLKSLPSVDLTGVAVRLDTLISQIDSMPLLSGEQPVAVAPPKPRATARQKTAPKPVSEWRTELHERWSTWTTDLWNDIRQLVRVRSVTAPEALLLTPEQGFFARENLKLRLLNARVSLLSRNDAAFRSDLAEADKALQHYFDAADRHTQAGRELIRQLRESSLSIETPSLSNSLAAVRQSRARP